MLQAAYRQSVAADSRFSSSQVVIEKVCAGAALAGIIRE
jgi:hypothetical protein